MVVGFWKSSKLCVIEIGREPVGLYLLQRHWHGYISTYSIKNSLYPNKMKYPIKNHKKKFPKIHSCGFLRIYTHPWSVVVAEILVETNAAIVLYIQAQPLFHCNPFNEASFSLFSRWYSANIFQGYKQSDSKPSLLCGGFHAVQWWI